MNNKPSALKRVLFVDDSPKFLQKLRTKMPAWSRDKWELIFAPDPAKAFVILDTQQVDLVVIDLRVSGMDNLQFLKLAHQTHPHIRKAMLSAFLEQETRTECLQSGADMYLIKPKRSNGFDAIFHSLNQLFTFSQEGFRGLLRTVSLTDLIQLECLNSRSSVLEISAGNQVGQVFIKQGAIIHARAGSKTGVDAFVRLMHMMGGDFNLKPFVAPGIQTIELSCDRLLLEASHAVDKGREQNCDDFSPSSSTSWFQNVPGQIHLDSPDKTLTADSSDQAINFLQTAGPAENATDFFPASNVNSQADHTHQNSLDAAMTLTDELIDDRSELDMKILDMALLKEELNSCKSKLIEVIGQMRDSTIAEAASKPEVQNDDKSNPLNRFICSLNEISSETSTIVGQLDGFFAAFIEESGKFNETSAKLQTEISRLQEFSMAEK